MLEIVVLIACVVLMYKIADMEGFSPIVWGALTAVLCIASVAIPLPYVRVVIGLIISFVAMMIYKAKAGP